MLILGKKEKKTSQPASPTSKEKGDGKNGAKKVPKKEVQCGHKGGRTQNLLVQQREYTFGVYSDDAVFGAPLPRPLRHATHRLQVAPVGDLEEWAYVLLLGARTWARGCLFVLICGGNGT